MAVALTFACRPEPAAPTVSPEPPVEQTSVALGDPIVRSTGPAFRQAYPRCALDFGLGTAGGEVFVIYMTNGIGRIDRLGARGEVVEAIDLDPGIESREAKLVYPRSKDGQSYKPPSYKWPAQPMADLDSLLGLAANDFYVSASFLLSPWTSGNYVAHYHDGAWSELEWNGGWLFEWGGRVMTHFHFETGEAFMGADEPVIATNFDDLLEIVATMTNEDPEDLYGGDVVLVAWDVDPTGYLAALATYIPNKMDPSTHLGTWLLTWTDVERGPTIDRVSSQVVADGEATVRVIGRRVFIQIGDEPQFEWRSGQRVALPSLSDAQALEARCERQDAMFEIIGPDSQGHIWAIEGDCLAIQDGEKWMVEALPRGIHGLRGFQFATLWGRDDLGTVWSREGPGRWASHELVLDGDPLMSNLLVMRPGDPWLEVTYDESDQHEEPLDPLGRAWWVSELHSIRPIEEPNPCR